VGSEQEEVDDHPVLDLLYSPNPIMSDTDLKTALAAHLLIAGNAYLDGAQAVQTGERRGRPVYLWPLRPDKVTVKAGTWREPVSGYRYDEGKPVEFDVDQVMHLKLFNPLDSFYGMGPIEAAARGIDQHNAASAWNTGLLQNGAAPPWVMAIKGSVKPEERENFKEQIQDRLAGPENARKPVVTSTGSDGGLDVTKLGFNPLEMDFLEGKKMSAYEIAAAFNVPAQLVGIPGAQTYANYEQARKALYTEGVLPLADMICAGLTRWLLPKFGATDLYLYYDKGQIDALQEDLTELFNRAAIGYRAGFLTQRQAAQIAGVDDDQAEDMYRYEIETPMGVESLSLGNGFSREVKALLETEYARN
jgi:HK97 family phage portal protein